MKTDVKSPDSARSLRGMRIFSTETPSTRLLKHLFRILHSTIDVKKEQCVVMVTQTAAIAAEMNACFLAAMLMAGRARPASNHHL